MIYLYHCVVCDRQQEIIKPLADIDRMEPCRHCDFPMERRIQAPAVHGDLPGYDCPITGKWIEGRRAHEENLKKHGCRIYEPGETEQAAQARKAAEERMLRDVDQTVGQFVESLPQDKVEALSTGLQNGLDVSPTRSSPI